MSALKHFLIGALALSLSQINPAVMAQDTSYRDRLPQDEVVYFMLPDRFENGDQSNDTGGIEGGRLDHGFDPTHKGFYHGGDLKGLTSRLDYIKDMGVTAIWLGPIYKNKPVQGGDGFESAGYHGYWITDFTDVDPHLGTKADLKAFVDGAHARGMKVYLDIITNHTADVIAYRECHDANYKGKDKIIGECVYRDKATYPWTTRGDANGKKINKGFMGDSAEFQTAENYNRLSRPDFAYTPYIPAGEENIKVPAWMNDLRYYHNRGETTFEGENSIYGDFVGLDDLMTSHPVVQAGFIDIFKTWVSDYKLDGFRVDTARHVNPEFWNVFIPAIIDHAKSEGIPNFYVFGESSIEDAGLLAHQTYISDFPYVLDFALWQAMQEVFVKNKGTYILDDLFKADLLYKDGVGQTAGLPTFTGNHDKGRLSGDIRRAFPEASDEEMFKRVRLAHALLYFGRGVPVIYSGDEQGFISDGNDQLAREDMFPSVTDVYNDNDLIATDSTTAESNFDQGHPLYKAFRDFGRIYKEHEALRRGDQIVRLSERDSGGLFAFSRMGQDGSEYLVVMNTGTEPRDAYVEVDPHSKSWKGVLGKCQRRSAATGSYRVKIAALDIEICRSAGVK